MILISYDGSADAKSAIEGALFHDQPAIVLTVWEPFVDVLARTPSGFGVALGMPDIDDVDGLEISPPGKRVARGHSGC